MMMLALECSTSAAKAGLYREDGSLEAHDEMPWSWTSVQHQDAAAIFATVTACARRLLQGRKDIAAIGLSGIFPSTLPLDDHMRPLSPLWTWANTACAPTAAKYAQDETRMNEIYRITGCPGGTQYPLWQLVHRRAHEDQSLKDAAHIVTQLGYIFYRLTHELAASYSVESSSSMLNLRTLDWEDELLEMAGLTRDMMSPLYPMDQSFPLHSSAADILGLPESIPVCVSAPDGILNQIGSGALTHGGMTLSVGTSGAIRMAVDTPATQEPRNTWCYYLYNNYIAGASTSGAGNCVNWFARSFAPGMSLEALEREAVQAGGDSLPLFLPFPFGERAPGFDGGRRGAFSGLDASHERGQLYRALLEGVLFNLYQCYELLCAKTGYPTEIYLSGGITHSPLWRQMAADLFQQPLILQEGEHGSLNGAAVLALCAAGVLDSPHSFHPREEGRVFPSDAGLESLMERYNAYLDRYEALKGK